LKIFHEISTCVPINYSETMPILWTLLCKSSCKFRAFLEMCISRRLCMPRFHLNQKVLIAGPNAIAAIVIASLFTLFVGSALASEANAIAISQNIRARHMPFGTILDPIFAAPDSDEIVGYTHCGDSAIWTGHYLAAEAYRYNVTRSPEALDNV